mmetsp:Transcript_5107/g.20833  ORF Transcript_5107/g.20833 Transcript_5107/m.20833 type:complete len:223 (+) Transcript_5107:7206-7874(+)
MAITVHDPAATCVRPASSTMKCGSLAAFAAVASCRNSVALRHLSAIFFCPSLSHRRSTALWFGPRDWYTASVAWLHCAAILPAVMPSSSFTTRTSFISSLGLPASAMGSGAFGPSSGSSSMVSDGLGFFFTTFFTTTGGALCARPSHAAVRKPTMNPGSWNFFARFQFLRRRAEKWPRRMPGTAKCLESRSAPVRNSCSVFSSTLCTFDPPRRLIVRGVRDR